MYTSVLVHACPHQESPPSIYRSGAEEAALQLGSSFFAVVPIRPASFHSGTQYTCLVNGIFARCLEQPHSPAWSLPLTISSIGRLGTLLHHILYPHLTCDLVRSNRSSAPTVLPLSQNPTTGPSLLSRSPSSPNPSPSSFKMYRITSPLPLTSSAPMERLHVLPTRVQTA